MRAWYDPSLLLIDVQGLHLAFFSMLWPIFFTKGHRHGTPLSLAHSLPLLTHQQGILPLPFSTARPLFPPLPPVLKNG
jgi:hypothetical protein